MARDEKPPLRAVLPLVGLARCVDAIGWLGLEGLCVSFMSGTTTMLGAATATGREDRATTLAATVALSAVGGDSGTVWWWHLATWSALVAGALAGGLISARLPADTLAVPMVWAALGVTVALLAGPQEVDGPGRRTSARH